MVCSGLQKCSATPDLYFVDISSVFVKSVFQSSACLSVADLVFVS